MMDKIKIKPFIEGTDFVKVANQTKNKKVRNATKIRIGDVIFKSKLEGYVYFRLTQLGIPFEYEKHRFTLIYPFTFQDQKIRAATYKPDFVGDNFVIECKGNRTGAWEIREKLAKRRFAKDFPQLSYYIVSSMIGFEKIVESLQEKVLKNVA